MASGTLERINDKHEVGNGLSERTTTELGGAAARDALLEQTGLGSEYDMKSHLVEARDDVEYALALESATRLDAARGRSILAVELAASLSQMLANLNGELANLGSDASEQTRATLQGRISRLERRLEKAHAEIESAQVRIANGAYNHAGQDSVRNAEEFSAHAQKRLADIRAKVEGTNNATELNTTEDTFVMSKEHLVGPMF